jgi:hypothetical protein
MRVGMLMPNDTKFVLKPLNHTPVIRTVSRYALLNSRYLPVLDDWIYDAKLGADEFRQQLLF